MLPGYEPVSTLYCAPVSGTTERRPWRTSGESANREFDLICASDIGLGRGLPALILTCGLLGSEASTETTVAVAVGVLFFPGWSVVRGFFGCLAPGMRGGYGVDDP